MNSCDPTEQQKRQDLLDAAYLADGRDQLPDGHPLKSTYTGLAESAAFAELVNAEQQSLPS